MESRVFPSLTPIVPVSDSYFSPRPSHNPAKRLRSCLSPTRTPSGERTPSRPASRTTSFGSECSTSDGWRRSKSVRWEGENEGCAVTSYHATWSATEYDRTPLDPPSEAERTCVLPERGSRTFTTSYDCFDDSPDPSQYTLHNLDEDEPTSSPSEETSSESLIISTPIEHAYAEGDSECEGEKDDEDRQWEECMERRRMMFAMRSKFEDGERQPEFEGYRSISAKLVEMLKSIEARRLPSPAETDEEDEDDEEEDHHDVSSILAEEEEEEDEEPEGYRSFSSFTFTNLQSLQIDDQPKRPMLKLSAVNENENDDGTDTAEFDAEANTPSLISCSETSESDQHIVSPRASLNPVIPLPLADGKAGLATDSDLTEQVY